MRNEAFALFAGLLAGASCMAGAAHAQAGQGASGAVASNVSVPGVCLLSREAVLANSAVGKSVAAQIKTLREQAEWELARDRTPLEDEARKLETQRGSLPADQYDSRQQSLATRWQALQEKAQTRGRELEATHAKAVERVFQEAAPLVEAAYRERECGLLLDRNIVLGGDMAGDLTEAVVRSLDAKIKTFPVPREPAPAPAVASTQSP